MNGFIWVLGTISNDSGGSQEEVQVFCILSAKKKKAYKKAFERRKENSHGLAGPDQASP